MPKDITGTLGATNHSRQERSARDYYGTDPKVVKELLDRESFCHDIWEPGSGHNLIVNTIKEHNPDIRVRATDIYDYGCQDEIIDFLECSKE